MKRILLVDDDFHLRRALEIGLQGLGYSVTLAADAIEAMRFVERNVYDVVVTDVLMPGITGFELAKQVHAVRPNLPVIFITANDVESYFHDRQPTARVWPSMTKQKKSGRQADATLDAPILMKPFVLSELVNLFELSADR
jgi:CheY-like chemotaxis protein